MPLTVLYPDALPDAYPAELEGWVVLRNGTRAFIRPIVPADADTLAEEILLSDSETLALRFFTPVVKPDAPLLDALTLLDYKSRLAVGMVADTGEGVGVARYGETEPGTVEVAVTVKTKWRRLGAADLLLDVVERAAEDRGYTTATALYLAHNKAAARLVAARGYVPVVTEDGVVEARRPL